MNLCLGKMSLLAALVVLKHISPACLSIGVSPGNPEEKDKVRKAADCCRKILNHVNQAVKESENKQVIALICLGSRLTKPLQEHHLVVLLR